MEGSMMGKQTLQQKWREQSEAAKREAKLLRMARQLQTASQINEWLSSPALQPPK